MGKRTVFELTFVDGKTEVTRFWQYRFHGESDLYHKKVMRESKLKALEEFTSKKDCILADFAFFHYKKRKTGGFAVTAEKKRTKYSMLAADFDVLPSGYKTFASLRKDLKKRFSGAIVLKTPSGKAKILFLVKQDMAVDSNAYGARWFALASLLGDVALNVFDASVISSYKVFFNREMLKQWDRQKKNITLSGCVSVLAELSGFDQSSKIRTLAALRKLLTKRAYPMERMAGEEEGASQNDHSKVPRGNRSVKRYRGRLNNGLKDLTSNSRGMERFIRLLVATPKLSSGAPLPQECIGHNLGVSLSTVSRYIRRLILLGVLEQSNGSYIPGVSAKEYMALGVLREANIEYSKNRRVGKSLPPPELYTIADGQWHDELFRLTNYFDSGYRYLNYVKQIPGVATKKSRLKQAVAAWGSHAKRNKIKQAQYFA